MINPLVCDPTRPTPIAADEQHGEIRTSEVSPLSLSTPHGDAVPLGPYTAATSTSDVGVGFMAELGQAVTRGAQGSENELLARR